MRLNVLACATVVVLLGAARVEAQFGGPGGGGGGFGGGGGGQFGAGGQQQMQLYSQQNRIQSPGNLPYIIGRNSPGTFGARAIGSATRQRVRGFLGGTVQSGGSASASGAFRSSRTQLPGSFSSFSTGQRGNTQQGNPQMAQPQQPQRRTAGAASTAARLTRPVKVSVGFEMASPSQRDAMVTAGLQRRLDKIPALDLQGVTLEGRTAVLRGSVATDLARELAERLIVLEPGIDSVRNELTTSEKLPAAPPGEEPAEETETLPSRPADSESSHSSHPPAGAAS